MDLMSTVVSGPECKHCGHPLSADHSGPCPKCGGIGKHWKVTSHAVAKGVASLSYKHVHEYWERHPVLLPVVLAIVVGSPFLGLFLARWVGVLVGLVVSVLGFLLGLRAVTRGREITRGRA